MNETAKNAKNAKTLNSLSTLACILGVLGGLIRVAAAADADQPTIEKVLTSLKNPRGVAIRPDSAGEPYEIFVAESGAGRIIKVASANPKKIEAVVGFPAPADGHFNSPGIQSLQFLDRTRLVVAGDDDGVPFVRLYELPETDTPLTAEHPKQDIQVPGSDETASARTLRGIARSQPNDRVGDILVIIAWNNGKTTGLVSAPVRAGTLGDAVPLVDASPDLDANAIAVGAKGHIVVASSSDSERDRSAQLKFLNPLDRRNVMQLPVELSRIVALAYSPRSGNLYAANFPTQGDGKSGIYRIDDAGQRGAPACTATKIADIRHPTALAFAADGTLYVTSSGNPNTEDAGALVKVTGDF